MVAAYGPAASAKPIVTQTTNSINGVVYIAADGSNSFTNGVIYNIKFQGIAGANSAQSGIVGKGRFDQLSIVGVDVADVGNCINFNALVSNLTGMWEQMTVQDFTCGPIHSVTSGNGNGVYPEAKNSAFMGMSINNASGGEHNFRSMYWDKFVITNSSFQYPNTNKAGITLRGTSFASGGGPLPPGTVSQYAMVWNNDFSNQPTGGAPLNSYIDAGADEAHMQYAIFDSNYFHDNAASNSIQSMGSYSSIRNNVVNGGSTAILPFAVSGNGSASQSVTDNTVYNNTFYTTSASASMFGVRTFNPTGLNIVKNNLIYTPNAADITPVDVSANSAGANTASNNSAAPNTACDATDSPSFDNVASGPSGFRIAAASCAVNLGTATATFPAVSSDFYQCSQSSGVRLGALVPRTLALCKSGAGQ